MEALGNNNLQESTEGEKQEKPRRNKRIIAGPSYQKDNDVYIPLQ